MHMTIIYVSETVRREEKSETPETGWGCSVYTGVDFKIMTIHKKGGEGGSVGEGPVAQAGLRFGSAEST